MKQHLAQFTLVVRDYDEAKAFYTKKLHFDLLEDTRLSETKRWVKVRPKGGDGCAILLAKAKNDSEEKSIGNQTGDVYSYFFTPMTSNGIIKIYLRRVEQS